MMDKKTTSKSLIISMLALGVIIGAILAIPALAAEKNSKYKVNKNNQTYGLMDLAPGPVAEQELPQLVAAVGVDGTEGYVYRSDLDGVQPKNPEEALLYMEKLNEEIEIAKSNRSAYLRLIPLYDEDGETVIGQFGISY